MSHEEMHKEVEQIAIIGMAGRFPGARNVAEFWQNLKDGVESIRSFTQEELKASGIDDRTLKEPNFVNAGAVMDDADCFDAKFFGLSVREAEIMDPQHRVLLEVAWEALENAGYDSERFGGLIGVFGGVAPNTYFQQNLVRRPDLLQTVGRYPVMLGSEKDYAITRISFKLNLTGPSISVNTACSTSGVAVHLASQSLLLGECDMALAGGARIMVPLHGGYLCEEGGILSTDGRVRAFDAGAKGTVVGSGAAMIVLKRLSDAISDRDNILAVIKGSAVNNDGSLKIGFPAPSVQGQTLVISEALAMADIDPETIGYIEAHGTGTALGDPIEVAALTSAFSKWTRKKGYCPIGTVKTNIGHLDAAAGVAGVIKTVLSLKHRQIPPSLNFNKANPQIDFDNSPVYVNTHLSEWPAGKTPRRAAVTVLGLGGTNAQIILEEPPEKGPSGPSRPHQLVLLSAKSAAALRGLTKNLADHLKEQPELNLADVSYTLQTGRQAFSHRRMVVCRDLADATVTLETMDSTRVRTSLAETTERDVVFMFSGQGSQYVNMGLELYQTEPVFREEIDRCSEILQPYLSRDLRQILYPEGNNLEEAAQMLQQTLFTQIALFVIEYGLAKLWMDWGVHPKAMVGHSIGEYVAACLAGVFSLEEALSLVVARSRLMQKLPGGSMLAVCLSEEEIQPFLGENLCLAAINGPALCTVSGDCEAIENLEKELSDNNGDCRPLHTSHAFHSKMMDPILDEFAETVRQFRLQSPRIPFLSHVSGNWISAEQATDPTYWANHLRQTVRFSC
ncbi:MAG: type I polyketide synthase, partial [Deltaproteobacteria bacterium]